MSVHAVILAGGYGTRMMPLTARRPKHLLPIGDEPVIAHQLGRLAAADVDSVTLATSYQAEAFVPALGHGEAYGLRLRYAHEETPQGTGGALRDACSGLDLRDDDAIVVLNGDLISEHDLRAHIAQHTAREAGGPLATIHGRPVDDASPFGLLHLDGDRINAFAEKPAGSPAGVANAGTYVVSPRLLDLIAPNTVISLEHDVFPRAAASSAGMRVYREQATFADIGTAAALLQANIEWAKGHGTDSVVLSAQVSSRARLERCLVMPGARIGAGAHCADTVIAPGAHIGADARVHSSVVGDDAVVSPGTHLDHVVLDTDARV